MRGEKSLAVVGGSLASTAVSTGSRATRHQTSSELPLLRASRRLKRETKKDKRDAVRWRKHQTRQRAQRRAKGNLLVENAVAVHHALGATNQEIAEVTGFSPGTVATLVRQPEVQQRAQELRDAFRLRTLQELQTMQPEAFQWLRETIKSRDPKAFDALTRGILATERTAASASGEPKRVEGTVQHQHDMDLSQEARDLIAALRTALPA